MKRPNAAARIFLYNWPTYVGTWVLALGILLVTVAVPRLRSVATIAGVIPIVWSFASLLVSFYIYDRSALLGGSWISRLLPASVQNWATIHAGLDAEVELDTVMPGRCLARLDIFDRSLMTASSLERARAYTARANAAVSCSSPALTLQDQSCDAVVVAFTAHEIRDLRIEPACSLGTFPLSLSSRKRSFSRWRPSYFPEPARLRSVQNHKAGDLSSPSVGCHMRYSSFHAALRFSEFSEEDGFPW